MTRTPLLLAISLLLFLCPAAVLESAEPPDAEEKDAEQGTAVEKRVVGTAVWAPRHDFARRSSALELFTPEVAEMRDKSLDFIRKSQQQSGAWGDKTFQENAGVTALCCLALLSEGSLPRIGPSGRELDRGVQFLLDHVKDDGQIAAKNTYKYGPMYGHAWSTLVLLQVYGNIPGGWTCGTSWPRRSRCSWRARRWTAAGVTP